MGIISCNGQTFRDVQAVFIDKDGTLADVANYLSQLGYAQAQLMEDQVPGSYDIILQTLGFNDEGLTASGLLAVGSRHETVIGTAAAAAMVGCPWIQATELAANTLKAADQKFLPKAKYTPLLPGALDFLKRLKQTRLKIIMVSADAQNNLENFVACYGLTPYFDYLQGVSSQQPSKVDPGFLQTACHEIGILPHQGVVIGDAASDLRMAVAARGFIGFLGGWCPQVSAANILPRSALGQETLPSYTFATDFNQILLN
ncbi:MAG: HAD family hydrolase [Cyanobacteria bacterium P01_F01_bin.13]